MATSRYIIQNKNKNTDSNWLLPFMIAFFFALGVAFSAGGFNYGRVFAVILAGITLMLNIEDAFCLVIFAFPFSSMLKFTMDTISIMPVLYLIIILKIIARGKFSIPPISLLCYFLFAILQALSMVMYDASYLGIISMLLNAGFVVIVSCYTIDREGSGQKLLPKASLNFAVGTSLMLLLSDIFPKLPMMVHTKKYTELIEANRYGATVLDPNELAQIILIAIGLLIAIISTSKSKVLNLCSVAMIIYMAATGIRTNSKSYAISLVLLFVFLLIVYIRIVAQKDGVGKAFKRFLPIVIIAVIGYAFLFAYFILPIFDARSIENTDLLTNRSHIWERYANALTIRADIALWGCGAGNVFGLMKVIGQSSSVAPHNAYLEYIIQFGVIGILLLATSWKSMFLQIKQKINSFYIIPLIAFLITAFGISVNTNDCPYILFALLSLPISSEKESHILPVQKKGGTYD